MRTSRFLGYVCIVAVIAGCGSGVVPDPTPRSYSIVNLGAGIPQRISPSGKIAGSIIAGGAQRAAVYDSGNWTELGIDGVAHDVSDVGMAAGETSFDFTAMGYHAFVAQGGGQVSQLAGLGGRSSAARRISNAGLVVGVADNADSSANRAILWQNGQPRDLGELAGDNNSEANAINGKGDIVGTSYFFIRAPDGGNFAESHAWKWQASRMMELPIPRSLSPIPIDVNDFGHIAGSISTGGFLFKDGLLIDLNQRGIGMLEALGLNNKDQVVGYTFLSGFPFSERAVLYSGGRIIDLNALIPRGSGWTLTRATGINDSGNIVGQGSLNGTDQGFLLVPEAAH